MFAKLKAKLLADCAVRDKSRVTRWFLHMWLVVPIAVWFSYRPLFRFGSNQSMYFELSVTTLVLAILAVLSLLVIHQKRHDIPAWDKLFILATGFVGYSGLTLFWGNDLTRGLLTLGILVALLLILAASLLLKHRIANIAPALVRITLATSVLMSILALLQVVVSNWLGAQYNLLCAGCTPNQLGFARPNVFTIEPQFLGNLFLLPIFLLLFLKSKYPHKKHLSALLLVISFGLFLTLSRGAIFALAVGVCLLLILEYKSLRVNLKSISIMLCSLGCVVLVQAAVAAANPSLNTTFYGALSTSLNQLSMNVIKLSDKKQSTPSSPEVTPLPQPTPSAIESAPNYDGYVEESTNKRLSLTTYALKSWSDNYHRILFGVGLGSSGKALKQDHPSSISDREIVQNEYVEILLETGLIGFTLFSLIIAVLLFKLRKVSWEIALILAFLVQWIFFSGLPNALHIYFILIIFSVLATAPAKKKKMPKRSK